jgi:predicted phosphate transport protein (TIGR00153 family)
MKFRKKETNYFEMLTAMVDCSMRTAKQLDDLLHHYTDVEAKLRILDGLESEGDQMLHGFSDELNVAFITPIDREDLLTMGNSIDSLTDAIEQVGIKLDMLGVTSIRPGILEVSKLMIEACGLLVEAMGEFERFKNSQKLPKLVIEVNHCEEKADGLYHAEVKKLYSSEESVLDILRWKEIYDDMEQVLDNCEDVADLLDAMALKNR